MKLIERVDFEEPLWFFKKPIYIGNFSNFFLV